MSTTTAYELHELATIFPEMDSAMYAELRDSIKTMGQLEPIVLMDEKVIDGRHRLKACEELGVEPATTVYDGDDPVAFVVAKNRKRRHMTVPELAFAAARAANIRVGEFAGNQHKSPSSLEEPLISQRDAAKMFGVGKSSVERAQRVQRQGTPELQSAVERGDIGLPTAYHVAALPKEEQQKITSAPEPKKAAREAIAQAKPQPKPLPEPAVNLDHIFKPQDGGFDFSEEYFHVHREIRKIADRWPADRRKDLADILTELAKEVLL